MPGLAEKADLLKIQEAITHQPLGSALYRHGHFWPDMTEIRRVNNPVCFKVFLATQGSRPVSFWGFKFCHDDDA